MYGANKLFQAGQSKDEYSDPFSFKGVLSGSAIMPHRSDENSLFGPFQRSCYNQKSIGGRSEAKTGDSA
jgi:hypothetical protein